LFRAQLAGRSDKARPFWTGTAHLASGTIALVVVPSGARDFFADFENTRSVIDRAVAHAGRVGAQCASLTGIIPAATDLGRSLDPASGVTLTTGHAATASAMGLTVRSVMSAARRNIRRQRFCFVGLGAIGSATLRTVLSCLDHPEHITLCDVV